MFLHQRLLEHKRSHQQLVQMLLTFKPTLKKSQIWPKPVLGKYPVLSIQETTRQLTFQGSIFPSTPMVVWGSFIVNPRHKLFNESPFR